MGSPPTEPCAEIFHLLAQTLYTPSPKAVIFHIFCKMDGLKTLALQKEMSFLIKNESSFPRLLKTTIFHISSYHNNMLRVFFNLTVVPFN